MFIMRLVKVVVLGCASQDNLMGQAHYTDALSKASREMGIEPVAKELK
jgi:hypothetical protein